MSEPRSHNRATYGPQPPPRRVDSFIPTYVPTAYNKPRPTIHIQLYKLQTYSPTTTHILTIILPPSLEPLTTPPPSCGSKLTTFPRAYLQSTYLLQIPPLRDCISQIYVQFSPTPPPCSLQLYATSSILQNHDPTYILPLQSPDTASNPRPSCDRRIHFYIYPLCPVTEGSRDTEPLGRAGGRETSSLVLVQR